MLYRIVWYRSISELKPDNENIDDNKNIDVCICDWPVKKTKVHCYCSLNAAGFRMKFWMREHFQGVLNHYNIKWRLEIIVSCLVPQRLFEPRWTRMTMALRAFLSVLCLDCNSVCRLRCDKSWRVCQDRHHLSAVIEPHDPISCENCFLSYGEFCVLYSGKIVFCIQAKLCFVFRQKWLIVGIRLVAWGNYKWDIRKRGCWGASPLPKRGAGGEAPQFRIYFAVWTRLERLG